MVKATTFIIYLVGTLSSADSSVLTPWRMASNQSNKPVSRGIMMIPLHSMLGCY